MSWRGSRQVQAAVVCGVVAWAAAWHTATRVAMVRASAVFASLDATGQVMRWRCEVTVGGVSDATVSVVPSCECASVVSATAASSGDQTRIVCEFRVDATLMEPGVRPGVWLTVRGVAVKLFRPDDEP